MTGEELYNRYKNKKILRKDGAEGILVGYGGCFDTNNGILALTKPFGPSRKFLTMGHGERNRSNFSYLQTISKRWLIVSPEFKFGR